MVALAQRYRTLLRTRVFLFGLAFMLAIIGCESGQSPTSASLDGAPAPGDDDKVYFVFSAESLSAAKVTGDDDDGDDDGLFTSKLVQPHKAANLKVGNDDLKAMFFVPRGAVAEPVRITIGVRPGPLSRIVVEMGPVGQVFDPSAKLKIELDADLVDFDLSLLEALVVSGDDIAPARIVSVETDEDVVTIRIDVHHFSRYGLRNSSYWYGNESYIDYLDSIY